MTPRDLAYLRWSNTTAAERSAFARYLAECRRQKIGPRERQRIARIAAAASVAARRKRKAQADTPET